MAASFSRTWSPAPAARARPKDRAFLLTLQAISCFNQQRWKWTSPSMSTSRSASGTNQRLPIAVAPGIRSWRRIFASATTTTTGEAVSSLLSDEDVVDDGVGEDALHIEKLVRTVRNMLQSMGDCAISSSPYDAGWMAMVPAVAGSGQPQFPTALDWVQRNQLPDGSWAGVPELFNLYDRLACTLSCVVALTTWSIAPHAVKQGCNFISKNLHKVGIEEDRLKEIHRTVGFEIVFSAMMARAKLLGLEQLPYDSPAMAAIASERARKLQQIPVDRLMSAPSTLLASLEGLEGLEGLDWTRIVKLAAPTGHMLSSPASTACVFMHTGDPTMLQYLTRLVEEFQGGVPNHSPMDVFERLWVVDRLQRLGIARFFQPEIKDILDMAYREWTPQGLSWASGCPVTDLDDTSMGFRLLRQHGYDVSPDVFHGFQKQGGKFSCWMDHGSDLDGDLTPAFNLYRASQTMFPGETVLEKAWEYTRGHLRQNLQNKTVADKWVLAKDLQGELEYALAWPWYASLPRVETRAYLDQYGEDDVWIAKTLYRMYMIQNPTFLSLAKADYNLCQRIYQKEVQGLQRWISDSTFDQLHFARHSTMLAGYLIMACCFFEPEMAAVREAGTKMCVVITMLDDYVTKSGAPMEEIHQFQSAFQRWDPSLINYSNERQRIVFMGAFNSINHLASQATLVQGRDVSKYIIQECQYFFQCCVIRAEWVLKDTLPLWDDFVHIGTGCSGFLPVALPQALLVPGNKMSDEVLEGEIHSLGVKGDLVLRLLNDTRSYQRGGPGEVNAVLVHLRDHPDSTEEEAIAHLRGIVNSTMQELVLAALRPKAAPLPCTKIYLDNAKMSYYMYADKDGWSDPSSVMKQHIHQLLYQSIPL